MLDYGRSQLSSESLNKVDNIITNLQKRDTNAALAGFIIINERDKVY